MNNDLCEYIEEYLVNICSGVIKTKSNEDMKFEWENRYNKSYTVNFRPLEISIILDNLISNARKVGAGSIRVEVLDSPENELRIQVSNDGKPLRKSDSKRIFEVGYTTTSGSGLGLAQVEKLLNEMNGSIHLNEGFEHNGTAFILEFGK